MSCCSEQRVPCCAEHDGPRDATFSRRWTRSRDHPGRGNPGHCLCCQPHNQQKSAVTMARGVACLFLFALALQALVPASGEVNAVDEFARAAADIPAAPAEVVTAPAAPREVPAAPSDGDDEFGGHLAQAPLDAAATPPPASPPKDIVSDGRRVRGCPGRDVLHSPMLLCLSPPRALCTCTLPCSPYPAGVCSIRPCSTAPTPAHSPRSHTALQPTATRAPMRIDWSGEGLRDLHACV